MQHVVYEPSCQQWWWLPQRQMSYVCLIVHLNTLCFRWVQFTGTQSIYMHGWGQKQQLLMFSCEISSLTAPNTSCWVLWWSLFVFSVYKYFKINISIKSTCYKYFWLDCIVSMYSMYLLVEFCSHLQLWGSLSRLSFAVFLQAVRIFIHRNNNPHQHRRETWNNTHNRWTSAIPCFPSLTLCCCQDDNLHCQ